MGVFRSPGANKGGIHQLESPGMRLPVDNVDRQLEKVERGIVELLNQLEINFLVIVPLVLLLLTILVLLFQLLKQMITAEQVIKTPTRCTQKKTLIAKMEEDHSFGFSDSIGKPSQLWPQKYAIRSKSSSSGSRTLFCLEKFQC